MKPTATHMDKQLAPKNRAEMYTLKGSLFVNVHFKAKY